MTQPVPLFRQCENAADEARAAARWLVEKHAAGHAWRDMVVLAPGKRNWRDPMDRALTRDSIPHLQLLGAPHLSPDLDRDHVHVMTLHAVEGLQFQVVAVLGVGDLPWKSQTLDEAARLAHVAMTRATHALQVFHSKPSALVERLLAA